MTIKERQLKVLNETISFYNSDNIAMGGDKSCMYITPNGKKCAIGRLISDDLASSLEEVHSNKTLIDIFELLPKEIQELDKEFLSDLQMLHDYPSNWDKNGLTFEGKIEVNNFMLKFGL